MTIACCLVVPEGVIFGADSTTTSVIDGRSHFMNHSQKIFEVGENSSIGIMTWGLTSLGETSYRTLFALLADQFEANSPKSMMDAANAWSGVFWDRYTKAFADDIARVHALENAINERSGKPVVDKAAAAEEDREYAELVDKLEVGFCIGGYCRPSRTPEAYTVRVHPAQRSQSLPERVDDVGLYGKHDLLYRMFDGFDFETRQAIIDSGLWSGDADDLDKIIGKKAITVPPLTIRDAIDFVHFNIYSTIKGIKFSTRENDCGGPIELAVITTDRNFRWVRHKPWASALGEAA